MAGPSSPPPSDRRLCLVVNPSAGGGRAARVLPEVEAELGRLGLPYRVTRTTSLAHADELAQRAASMGETVVALGGDGLVGCVAQALRGVYGGVMGVLPGGRGNDFARAAGLPLDLAAACAVLATGTPRALDLGDVGGRAFVGIASTGFDAEANRVANAAPARLGKLVYAYGALRALAGWRHARFTVTVDGVEHPHHGWTVAAANSSHYGGGMLLAPDAVLDDGLLDVVLIGATGRLRFLRALPMVFKGTHTTLPMITVLRGREITVSADRPMDIYADGDPIGTLPVTIGAVPGAVRVLLP